MSGAEPFNPINKDSHIAHFFHMQLYVFDAWPRDKFISSF